MLLFNVFFIDQRDKIQKKTFTKWMNKHLTKVSLILFDVTISSHVFICKNETILFINIYKTKKVNVQINDLFDDLRDGVNLILLLEILTNRNLVILKTSFAICLLSTLDNRIIYIYLLNMKKYVAT